MTATGSLRKQGASGNCGTTYVYSQEILEGIKTKEYSIMETKSVMSDEDSMCMTYPFNQRNSIRGLRIKRAINGTKQKLEGILGWLPRPVIHLAKLARKRKTAEAANRLHNNRVKVQNNDVHRHWPKG